MLKGLEEQARICKGNSNKDTKDIREIPEVEVVIVRVKEGSHYIPKTLESNCQDYCPYFEKNPGMCNAGSKRGFCYNFIGV